MKKKTVKIEIILETVNDESTIKINLEGSNNTNEVTGIIESAKHLFINQNKK